MLNPDVAVPIVFLIVASSAMVQRWFTHRERMASFRAGVVSPVESERLLRLEQAVETIALETERIGEGQRYLTRLLAERADRDTAHASDRP